ncbi:MAG: S-layer homology domain-containing protein [Chloroflexia bacterium]
MKRTWILGMAAALALALLVWGLYGASAGAQKAPGGAAGGQKPPQAAPSARVYSAPQSTWNIGDVFLGVGNGMYQVRAPDGTLKETLDGGTGGYTTGCALDSAGNLFTTQIGANEVLKYSATDPHPFATFGSGSSSPESVEFNVTGDVFVGNVGGNGILEFASNGTLLAHLLPGVRVDWFDLAADQDTIYYTAEDANIYTFSIAHGSQPNFETGLLAQAAALRILADGGVLVSDVSSQIRRLNRNGAIIQTYTAAGESKLFALNLDPNGTSFWSGDIQSANYYRWNIVTGAVEIGPINTGTGPQTLYGICVKGEITTGQPTPTATPTPARTATPGGCTTSFSDVHPADYFYTPVLYLACHGVISGYSDGTFRPYNNTTRSQMVKIVVLGFNKAIVTPAGTNYSFTDVPRTNPFFSMVETAYADGIVSGYNCGTAPAGPCDSAHRPYFLPFANVTRGQLSKIDVIAAGWTLYNPAAATFSDVPHGSVFYTVIETAVCHGVISGYSDLTFRPFNNAIRGQIAKIVYLSIVNPPTSCGP